MKKLSKLILFIISLNFTLYAHEGHGHKAQWEACDKKQKEDTCSYTNGEHDLFQGTCQYFNEALMCVRNKPIVKAKDVK